MMNRVEVAAAVIYSSSHPGQVLLAKRQAHQHQGGLWEFPGGKIEQGETKQQALIRELKEELGIDVMAGAITPLIRVAHHYPDKSVVLNVMCVQDFQGQPAGQENQQIGWFDLTAFSSLAFPAANLPILKAISLPSSYLISPELPNTISENLLVPMLEKAFDGYKQYCSSLPLHTANSGLGEPLFQWRQPGLMRDAPRLYQRLTIRVIDFCQSKGIKLLLNADLDNMGREGVRGLHLPFAMANKLSQRPVDAGQLLGVSCHSPNEITQAMSLSPDFICLSPVLPTQTHPNAKPIGWERFADWIADLPLPVYALGGLGLQDILQAKQQGAQGIACIRGWWPLSELL